jgi:hypothetical protein
VSGPEKSRRSAPERRDPGPPNCNPIGCLFQNPGEPAMKPDIIADIMPSRNALVQSQYTDKMHE